MKKKIILDILFYLVIPLLFWNLFRDFLGAYYTLLAAMVPGTVYAILTFTREKGHRITGYVLFGGMLFARLMDLIVSTPEGILWNDVRMNLIFAFLWGISLLIKKPIGMYFFLDYACYSGIDYRKAKAHYFEQPLRQFYILTLILLVQDLIMAGLYSVLIKTLGIDGFNKIHVAMSILNYVNIGIIAFYVAHIIRFIHKTGTHKSLKTNV